MSFNEWRPCKLGDLCESISVTHNFQKDSLIFLNTGDIERGKILHRDYSDIKSMPGQAKKTIKQNDILFSEIRPANGRYAYVDFDADDYVVSTKLMVIRSKQAVLPKFLYLFLTSNQTTDWLQHLAESRSGTFPQITFSQVAGIDINLPSKPEQEKIVSFLYALDGKIELNRQTNQTLEAIAQAIYKEWFVNFNFPGATGEMQDSDLGLIPRGWRIISLGEITDLTWGDTNTTKKSYVPVGYPAFSASGQDGFLPHHDFDRDGIVISAIGAYAGKTWFAIGKWSCIKNTIRFWSIHPEISNEYLYMATSGAGFWPLRGSAQPFISQTDARGLKVLFPSGDIAKKFGEVTNSIFRQIAENDIQSNYLSQVRDGLLPRLMTGEIEL